jgi:hypothetical protein
MTGSVLQFPERYYFTVLSSFVITRGLLKRHVIIPIRMIFNLFLCRRKMTTNYYGVKEDTHITS